MARETQILSHEMILPAYKAAISPGSPPKQTPHPAQLASAIAPLHLSRALYKSTLFMQNKPNFLDALMNVNKVLTRDYEKKTLGEHGKNKPNTNPIKTQFPQRDTRYEIQTQTNPTCSELVEPIANPAPL